MKNIWTLTLIFLVIGGILLFVGFKELALASASSGQPEEISLRALINRGPGGNPNIILKDFAVCDNYVFQTRNGAWQSAWVPVVPREELVPGQMRGGKPVVIRALLFTINARGEADLYQRCEQSRLRALVTNGMVSLGGEVQNLLRQSYPGTDFSRCLIIQEGREPAGAVKLIFFLGGGGLLAAGGLGLGVFGLIRVFSPSGDKVRKRRRRDDEEEEAPPRRRPRDRDFSDEEEEDRPRRRGRYEDDDADDDRPRRRRRADE